LSRRGRSLSADASGFDPHRDSITSRFDEGYRFAGRGAARPAPPAAAGRGKRSCDQRVRVGVWVCGCVGVFVFAYLGERPQLPGPHASSAKRCRRWPRPLRPPWAGDNTARDWVAVGADAQARRLSLGAQVYLAVEPGRLVLQPGGTAALICRMTPAPDPSRGVECTCARRFHLGSGPF
jgi:hypothetical protein